MTRNEIILAPSILAGDHAYLARSARQILEMGLRWVHLDIMDGHFVPNLTFGPQTLADLRKTVDLFFDTHLMLDEPHHYVTSFAQAGADLISIHIEPSYPIRETLAKIHELGCQNGIVLNPDTPVEALSPYLDRIDLVLVMTVQPGFGGQRFREDTLPKIGILARWRQERGLNFRLEVDGGITLETARLCREQGCDTFVVGTAFFKAKNKREFAANIIAEDAVGRCDLI